MSGKWQFAGGWIAAAVVGVGAGAAWAWWPAAQSAKPDAPIEWNSVQAVPTRAPDPEDVAWQKRAVEADTPSTSSTQAVESVRASFGFCYVGGGTNCVVDGDTFWFKGVDIRIADIDAPETHDWNCPSEKQLGDKATARLRELLNSGPITLSTIDRDEDVYGRKLRNVSVNGTDVGEILISEGLAHRYVRGKLPWC
jgi:endonuclease YncB( thermonuclease family)